MLSHYGVENGAINIENKINVIHDIQTTFIAKIGDDFGVVYEIEGENVSIRVGSLNTKVNIKQFCDD
ncbi:hypothetical protein [Sphingobacterium sp. Mn56C]|uniref:hypothetical protein n=1 Tax=Sphingobacterium sp. Mn56C TaxID=3395261 RepID=UPI003BF4C21D